MLNNDSYSISENFMLDTINDETLQEYAEAVNVLKELFSETGIEIDLSHQENSKYAFLYLRVDKEKLRKRKTRNAGPGYKVSARRISQYKSKMSYKKVLELQKDYTNKEICSMFNCSESAFYRQLRKRKKEQAEQKDFDENVSFF